MLNTGRRIQCPPKNLSCSGVAGRPCRISRLCASKSRRRGSRHKAASPREAARFRDSGEVHKWMYDRYSLRTCSARRGSRPPRPVLRESLPYRTFTHIIWKPVRTAPSASRFALHGSRKTLRSLMRIVLVSTFDQKGGAGLAALRLMRGLRALGHECSMLVKEKTSVDSHVRQLRLESDRTAQRQRRASGQIQKYCINRNRPPSRTHSSRSGFRAMTCHAIATSSR